MPRTLCCNFANTLWILDFRFCGTIYNYVGFSCGGQAESTLGASAFEKLSEIAHFLFPATFLCNKTVHKKLSPPYQNFAKYLEKI